MIRRRRGKQRDARPIRGATLDCSKLAALGASYHATYGSICSPEIFISNKTLSFDELGRLNTLPESKPRSAISSGSGLGQYFLTNLLRSPPLSPDKALKIRFPHCHFQNTTPYAPYDMRAETKVDAWSFNMDFAPRQALVRGHGYFHAAVVIASNRPQRPGTSIWGSNGDAKVKRQEEYRGKKDNYTWLEEAGAAISWRGPHPPLVCSAKIRFLAGGV